MILTKLTTEMMIGLAFIGVGVVGLIYLLLTRRVDDDDLEGASEALLENMAEYRTYMVNQWLSLLIFWFGINVEEAETKLTTPGPNKNTVYFFYQNLEIYAYFNWVTEIMTVKTSVYEDEEGYTSDCAVFSISGKDLPTKDLFPFIEKARLTHKGCYELTAADVEDITNSLRVMRNGFSSEDAAKEHLFDQMADLMLLMRKKKNRGNRKLLKFYMGLLYWFWNSYHDEFLKYLEVPAEDCTDVNKENSENTEENE